LNALVWASFPRSKLALHERQLRALVARLPPGARTLPPTRSREHDALALIDEGGVVILRDGRAEVEVVFGHALYEGRVLGRGPMTACALPVLVASLPADPRDQVALADAGLACIWSRGRSIPARSPASGSAKARPCRKTPWRPCPKSVSVALFGDPW
jgi:hypothetical protein